MKIMMLNQDNLNDEPVFKEMSYLPKKGAEIDINGQTKYVVDCVKQDKGEPDREFVGSYTGTR